MRKFIFLSLLLVITMSVMFSSSLPVEAKSGDETVPPCPTGQTCLPNPLGEGKEDPKVIVGGIIKVALGIMGSLALFMFIWGGFLWMTAQGASEKITKGKDTIIWAIFGMAIILSSYAILNFVIQSLVDSTKAG